MLLLYSIFDYYIRLFDDINTVGIILKATPSNLSVHNRIAHVGRIETNETVTTITSTKIQTQSTVVPGPYAVFLSSLVRSQIASQVKIKCN